MNLLKLITPVNLYEEKERFFSSSTYQPVFRYERDQNKIDTWLKKQPHYRLLVNAVLSEDNQKIVKAASELFQTKVSEPSISKANEIINQTKPSILETDINKLSQKFQEAFTFFNLDFDVNVVDKHGFNLRPSYSEKSIVISKHLQLDFFSPEGEVRHELAHIIRYINGKQNNIKRSKVYLPTEEGLATYFHDHVGDEPNYSLFQHATEYAITAVGLNSSLREMIDILCSYGFSRELSWQRAARHKFGLIDTSKPGDIMKPAVYFHHSQIIKELSDKEKLRLMVGKISLNELNKYESYSGQIPEKKIKSFYNI